MNVFQRQALPLYCCAAWMVAVSPLSAQLTDLTQPAANKAAEKKPAAQTPSSSSTLGPALPMPNLVQPPAGSTLVSPPAVQRRVMPPTGQRPAAQARAATPQKAAPQVAAPRIVNRVAATVNGRTITSSELRDRIVPIMMELRMLYPRGGTELNQKLIKAKEEILEELIERELVLSEFYNKGFTMPEEQIETEVNNRVLNQFGGDRDKLINMLRARGETLHVFRKAIRQEMAVGAMRQGRYASHIPPTPDEIKAEYAKTKRDYRDVTKDKVRFSKIYLPMEQLGSTTDEILEKNYTKAVQIAEQIRSKKMSFAEAAKTYSRDHAREDGGRWDEVKRGDLAPEFAAIVFNAKKGEILGPLYDPSGFTIVMVEYHKEANPPSLSDPEVREKVSAAALRRKSEKNYRVWIDRLKRAAIIRRYV